MTAQQAVLSPPQATPGSGTTPTLVPIKKVSSALLPRALHVGRSSVFEIFLLPGDAFFGTPPRAKAKLLGLMAAGLASATLGLAASPAQAIAITAGIDNLSGGNFGADGAYTLGYEFSLSNAATVNALGSYDHNGDGLGGTYTVGLWNVAGTLLASATVGTADQLASSFRWADITDITLGAGNYIVASAGEWSTNNDSFYWNSSFTTNQLTYVTDRWSPGATLTIPNISQGGAAPGWLGGNVSFASTTSTSVPGPLPILGIAAAFGFSRKLRKRIKLHRGSSAVSTPSVA